MSYLQATVPIGRPPELPELLARVLNEFEVYWCGSWVALRCLQCGDRIGLYRGLSMVTFVSIVLRHPRRCRAWRATGPDPLEEGLNQYLYETGTGS